MSTMVIFGGRVSGEGTTAEHALRVDITYDLTGMRCSWPGGAACVTTHLHTSIYLSRRAAVPVGRPVGNERRVSGGRPRSLSPAISTTSAAISARPGVDPCHVTTRR